MKKLLAVLALALVSCSHVPPSEAQPLFISGIMPAQDNAGTCAAPTLVAAPAVDNFRRIIFSWSGPVAGVDSVYVQPGGAFSFTKYVPSGTYTLLVRPVNLGGWCRDTTLTKVISNPPAGVVVN